ncbi:MAG: SOS response-associated peptidase [Lutibacter sp.]
MCYQTRIIKKREEIAERFNLEISNLKDYVPTEFCKAFDYPKTPIITNKSDKIQFYNWGLIPPWSPDKSIRQYTLNARIETLSEKKSFKSVINNRCLIIADGFYEWQWKNKSGSKKEKYLITLPNEDIFCFAGLYSEWISANNEKLNSYTIVTTEANDLMATIHNTKKRMPVILNKEAEQLWLNNANYKSFSLPYTSELKAVSLTNQSSNQFGLFN